MADKLAGSKKTSTGVGFWFLFLTGMWTAAVCASLYWSTYQLKDESVNLARMEALARFEKDVLYRRWNAEHGRVYIPATDASPPNPYLTDIEERDIELPSGLRLTMVNPAYMTRQVHELGFKTDRSRGHITSLKPIRPENAPDAWEKFALKAFQNGKKEHVSIETMDLALYLRFMRPLITEQGCLKCHAKQGYKIGEIRGGISQAVPMAPYLAIYRSQVLPIATGHSLLWIMGMMGIGIGSLIFRRRILERRHSVAEREKLITELQTALATVKQMSGLLPICSSCKRIRDDKGYWNQIEIFIRDHSGADFTHSVCPDCMKEIYGDLMKDK